MESELHDVKYTLGGPFHAGGTENSVLLASCVVLFFNEISDYSKLHPHPPPSVQSPGILTFEDWIVQIPVPSGQDNVQRLCPICRICWPNTPPKEQNMALYVMMPSAKTKTKNYEI